MSSPNDSSSAMIRIVVDDDGESTSWVEGSSIELQRQGRFLYADTNQMHPFALRTLRESLVLGKRTCAAVPRDFIPKALFFDMDATVIAEESIVILADIVGKKEEVAAITEEAMAGKIDFEGALRRRVSLLKGLTRSDLTRAFEKVTVNSGIEECVRTFSQQGVSSYLISGGFQDLARPLAEKIGFAQSMANEFDWQGDTLSGNLQGEIVDADKKRSWLLAMTQELGVSPNEVVAVGDGANDLPMLKEAGIAIGFSPKPVLIPHLDGANFSGDHRMLQVLFGQ